MLPFPASSALAGVRESPAWGGPLITFTPLLQLDRLSLIRLFPVLVHWSLLVFVCLSWGCVCVHTFAMQSRQLQSNLNLSATHVHDYSHHSVNMSHHDVTHHKCIQPCTFNCCMSMCKKVQLRQPQVNCPYSGNLGGMTWNPRAFFARKGMKMSRRIAKVRQMCSKLDFFGLQETHSSPERAAALQNEFPEHLLFWSHCSLQRGGLALGVATSFLQQFAEV